MNTIYLFLRNLNAKWAGKQNFDLENLIECVVQMYKNNFFFFVDVPNFCCYSVLIQRNFPIVFKWSWVIVRDLVNVDWLRCFSDLYSSQSCWVIRNNSDKYQGTITSTLKRPSGQKYKNLKYIQFYWIKPALFSQARQAWAIEFNSLLSHFPTTCTECRFSAVRLLTVV